MKKLNVSATILTLLILFTSSCDVPTNPDSVNYARVQQDQTSNTFTNSPSSSDFSNSHSFRSPSSNYSSQTDITIPSEVDHCLWSDGSNQNFMYSSQHLSQTDTRSNAFTLCQSRTSKDVVYFQIEKPVSDVQICFIPMNHQGSNSPYIGEPRCLNATDNKKLYRIQMYKTRWGFENLDINGVMIIKDKMYSFSHPYNASILATDAFLMCNQRLRHPIYPTPEYCKTFISHRHYHFQRF